ncbi:ATP-binding protein [Roseitranquillus sediminis]|uniref:ATP-binding protein n=1 Tax=Roseitranquillus sediminis TaxID=2809051 RepID=UPI001D0C3296|nr:ATP-binding protein [Roseitranquillus sediminis]MBM9595684.1 sodium:solute symporter [Roseitranquillus sediminis]
MLSLHLLLAVCLLYVGLLFLVAWAAEKRASRGQAGWLRSPAVYTLSLSIYCTAWTFYGAVGYAARSGLEFMTIYLGPTLVMVGWWGVVRKLVRIGRSQRITSIADLVSSRYGKSNLLGALVTVLAVLGSTPYIALQLQSVTLSVSVFAAEEPGFMRAPETSGSALWVAAGLTLFTIVFGTRKLDVNERHHGIVTAIALEAVVKLVALLAVGVFVVWGVAGGVAPMFDMIDTSRLAEWQVRPSRWIGYTLLAGVAFLTLPRMFQVLVVENPDERHLATASWAFPLYLMAMSLFVLPIAVAGLAVMPAGSNPDLFVLTVPLAQGREGLALLAFLGGFSSATSMVIVAAIALATMVSNNIVLPIWLSTRSGGGVRSGDVREVVLASRRLSIGAVLALGYAYYRVTGGGEALAAIGLISFVGVAQVAPALVGGVFWRGATRIGAVAGLLAGFLVWVYTLFLPSFGEGVLIPAVMLAEGPWGIGWLRPRALFGIEGLDPVVHAMFWSLSINICLFLAGSILTFPKPLERLQGATFVNVFRHAAEPRGWSGGSAEAEDLLMMAQRILGSAEAQALFSREVARQGRVGFLPDPTPAFLERLERELAGSVGAATAHAMLGQIIGGSSVSVEDLMRVADETAQIMEYSAQLEAKSSELERTARQLRDANEKLTALSHQKDAFLSQISHELRTPMTSIRAFSEILRDGAELGEADRLRYTGVIHDEAVRLTRLLDDLLDLSVLENGQVMLNVADTTLRRVIDRAVSAAGLEAGRVRLRRDLASEAVAIRTDPDRLAQVFINVLSNAAKYCEAPRPELAVHVRSGQGQVTVDFIDNGRGIPREAQNLIFEKFSRLTDQRAAGGAGLGLAICREIMANLGGDIAYLPGQGGAAFRVTLATARAQAAE